jgi:single-strand DNA-binding protein
VLNKAILVGRLTKDPEIRSTASAVSVLNFTVAVPRKYVKQGEQRQSDFINCVAFGKTADFISRFFTKGNMISIDGSIQTRNWDDNEGKRHWVTEVIVNDAGFVESKKDSAQAMGGSSADQPMPDLPPDFGDDVIDDDLPF